MRGIRAALHSEGVVSLRIQRSALLLTAIAATVVALTVTPASSAWAYGCSYGNPNFGPAQYCVFLSGGGTWVNSVTGNFAAGAEVRNWYITAEFFDTSWRWYQTYNGATHWGCCWNGAGDIIYINAYKRPGYMCSTLHYQAYVYGVWSNRAMSVCHSIHS